MDFVAVPGILHAEIHLYPLTIECILRCVDKKSKEYRTFTRMFDDAQNTLKSGQINTCYQGFFDIILLINEIIIPSLESQVLFSFQNPSRLKGRETGKESFTFFVQRKNLS